MSDQVIKVTLAWRPGQSSRSATEQRSPPEAGAEIKGGKCPVCIGHAPCPVPHAPGGGGREQQTGDMDADRTTNSMAKPPPPPMLEALHERLAGVTGDEDGI